jgi:hypothetical protein
MTAHSNRCKRCKHGGASKEGGGWCYRRPPTNGGHRQWIDETTYNDFIALLGCASFEIN